MLLMAYVYETFMRNVLNTHKCEKDNKNKREKRGIERNVMLRYRIFVLINNLF